MPDLLTQYGCGPIRFSGDTDALYERHLLFDDIIAPYSARPRERFEAVVRSVRDVLSQRWVLTFEGLKVVPRNGWFAARPSGTEAVYKIYAESFKDEQHLQAILADAQQIVAGA